MGANARKINNARSQQVFKQASEAYGKSTEPTALEGQVQGMVDKPYSDQETQDIRTRSLRPIQSAYAHSGQEIQRQSALSGGAPNTIAALAKTTRDRTNALSEGTMDVNARLAEDTASKRMQAAGLLGGLQGQRQSYGLGLMGSQSSVRPYEGFGWGKLAGLVGSGLGAAATAFGGGRG